MKERIPGNIQSERSRELHAIAREQKHRAMQAWVGSTRPVLWEGHRESEGKVWISGYTPEFHRVGLWVDPKAAAALPYSIRETTLLDFDSTQECLTGRLDGTAHG